MARERRLSWPGMFAAAVRGIVIAVGQERAFLVHVPATIGVLLAAAWLRALWLEWAVLVLCIGGVWSAELLNTALERLACSIDANENPLLRDALDIAAGAVLVLAVGATAVGAMILGVKLWAAFGT